jgi:hypothetical protein
MIDVFLWGGLSVSLLILILILLRYLFGKKKTHEGLRTKPLKKKKTKKPDPTDNIDFPVDISAPQQPVASDPAIDGPSSTQQPVNSTEPVPVQPILKLPKKQKGMSVQAYNKFKQSVEDQNQVWKEKYTAFVTRKIKNETSQFHNRKWKSFYNKCQDCDVNSTSARCNACLIDKMNKSV